MSKSSSSTRNNSLGYIMDQRSFSLDLNFYNLNHNDPSFKLPPLEYIPHYHSTNIRLPSISVVLKSINDEQSTAGRIIYNNQSIKLVYSHRKRRKSYEINRKFKCSYPNCNKSYGALNHLNYHIKNQNHGELRRAKEFKSKCFQF